MSTVLKGIEGIRALVGHSLGYGEYVEVTQERIDQFADATGDHQWIHVDVERARSGPYGKTIAHGLLTLSMIGVLSRDMFHFEGFRMGVHYGYESVRFPSPVPVGSRIRLGATIVSCEGTSNGVQTVMEQVIEIEGSAKPACVARMIFRHVL